MFQAIFDEQCADFFYFESLRDYYWKLGFVCGRDKIPNGKWPIMITDTNGQVIARDEQVSHEFLVLLCAMRKGA